MTDNFIETRLDMGIDYGTLSSLMFRTSIVVLGDGSEQRIINWEQPLLRFQLGLRTLSNLSLNYLQTFLNSRKGSLEGFRFKDWSDYQAKNQFINNGNGEKSQFQLIKTYLIGPYSVNRPITKPSPLTTKIYINGIELTDNWSVDVTTGMITFLNPPTGTITADFEFEVPVRFEQDKINYKFKGFEKGTERKIFEMDQLSLLEIRELTDVALTAIPKKLNHIIQLGYDLETLGGISYSTQINQVFSGFEKRESNWDIPKGSWDIGARTLTRQELDYLITLFRVCRGRGTNFKYKDWATEQIYPVRFGEDSISFRFDAYEKETERVIFYLAGTPINKVLSITHLFGTYLSKGGPFINGNYICNGGCNVYFYWRTIDPVVNLNENYSFVVKDGFWYIKNDDNYYQIDFIYPNNYIAKDTGNNRGYPEGPFSPHGVGIAYIPSTAGCVPQNNFYSSGYGDNPVLTQTVEI